MSSCLGLYIEEYLIKYAKVSKERDKIKVESFGMKFYEGKLGEAISQIVEERSEERRGGKECWSRGGGGGW